ncbi:hypothetical protein QGM71_08530 [Virgibacillus sp. C22-A2]|uniref:GNAT family N-acetyltransferase n=1 Tax=Virgibacillus tibetensis TaxID=3042313 RepID=A0ABU6KDW8_9BACI|nr:hypothetical protein [Virgibacillus sp. C22-A2]
MFQQGKLKVRNLEEKDHYLLAKWLSDLLVLEFYEGRDNPFDLVKVNKVFYASESDSVRCIVEFENKEIGYIQFYQLDDETKKDYGYLDELGSIKFWLQLILTLKQPRPAPAPRD